MVRKKGHEKSSIVIRRRVFNNDGDGNGRLQLREPSVDCPLQVCAGSRHVVGADITLVTATHSRQGTGIVRIMGDMGGG